MLNKEEILALAWEYSEASGKRYTFTEESLFEFLKELKKEPAPAQHPEAEGVKVVAWLNTATEAVTVHPVQVMDWDDESEPVESLMTVAQHERIVASLARPAQAKQSVPEGYVLLPKQCPSWLEDVYDWSCREHGMLLTLYLPAYDAMVKALEEDHKLSAKG